MIIETLRAFTIPGIGQIGAREVFNAIAIGEFTVGIKFKDRQVVLTNGHKLNEWREVRARVTPTAQSAVSQAAGLPTPKPSTPNLL